ncbi:hypothetical protein [Paenibacillus sp. y28]|uniref:hypothetical protein n=1 Tax=Paenibacillus sp. y28 TaxID=3129110 RepID=UPI003017E80B
MKRTAACVLAGCLALGLTACNTADYRTKSRMHDGTRILNEDMNDINNRLAPGATPLPNMTPAPNTTPGNTLRQNMYVPYGNTYDGHPSDYNQNPPGPAQMNTLPSASPTPFPGFVPTATPVPNPVPHIGPSLPGQPSMGTNMNSNGMMELQKDNIEQIAPGMDLVY